MANNGVSQHFKIDGGADLTSDSQFATLGANTKIVYKPNSEKYIKNSSYSNVFDKTISYATEGDLTDIKNEAIKSISNADANGKVTYTAINGSTGSFDCHVKVTDENTAASWGTKTKIATIDGKDISITLPSNPNTDTKYYAGTALTLNGTTFNHNNYINDPGTLVCIAENGMYLDGNKLKIKPLTFNVNAQGHVAGFKNADDWLSCDLSSVIGSGSKSEGEASGTQGWIRIGNILVQWFKTSTGRETPYPYGTYATPPLGFYSFCSQNYHITADCSDYSGILQVSTDKCYYDQDGDNRYHDDISVMVIGVAASSSSGSGSSGGESGSGGSTPSTPSEPETPTTHIKTVSVPSADLVKQGSTSYTFTDEEVFNYIKGKDPGAVSLVNFTKETISAASLVRVTSITYYTTTA